MMFKVGYSNTLLRVGLFKTAGVMPRIRFVDGGKVRDNLSTEFVLGGHHYRYNFIPEDEIWIERLIADDQDRLAIIAHEIIERALMKSRGMKYDAAHETANKFEIAMRRLRRGQ